MKKYRIYSENSQEYREYEKKVKDSKTTYEYDALLTFQEFINKVCGSTGKVISLETDSEWINCKSFEKNLDGLNLY